MKLHFTSPLQFAPPITPANPNTSVKYRLQSKLHLHLESQPPPPPLPNNSPITYQTEESQMKSSTRSSKGIKAIQVVGCYDLFTCAFEVKCCFAGKGFSNPAAHALLVPSSPHSCFLNSTPLGLLNFYRTTSSPRPLFTHLRIPRHLRPPPPITRSRLQLSPVIFGARYGRGLGVDSHQIVLSVAQ